MSSEDDELAYTTDEGLAVAEHVHPLSNLLRLDASGVLAAMRESQRADFLYTAGDVERQHSPLRRLFDGVAARADADNAFRRIALFQRGALGKMFLDLHDHVMSHPVWLHPFFVRVFEGRFDADQAAAFAVHYFNQVKNTRQCVALAIGRFHSLMGLPFGPLNERVSEMTQIVLAQVAADEYGVGSHEVDDYPALARMLKSKTHIAMYRQFLDGLGVAAEAQDEPMLPGVADNVLTQRLVAGHPDFSPLEALASVGLGMEWGVPEFFTLLLGGLIRYSLRGNAPLTPRHLEVFIAHVRFDVLHAISVMLVTSLHMSEAGDLALVKNACNMLMASRYEMMSDMYRFVFGEDCGSLADVGLEPRYRLADRRIDALLKAARAGAAPGAVVGREAWLARPTPFVFV